MATILLAIAVFGIFFLLLSIRVIFIKDGKFRGTCAAGKEGGGSCGYCGRDPGEGDECGKEELGIFKKVLPKL